MKFIKERFWVDVECSCGDWRRVIRMVDDKRIIVNCYTQGEVKAPRLLDVGVCDNPCCRWSAVKGDFE